ncbi:MAG: peptidoglycan binding protein CsiV [Gammaproteobacteria bacterium]|nr:peptidoglycan binding protein CsiV [Gammaproteobacteria bacterium]
MSIRSLHRLVSAAGLAFSVAAVDSIAASYDGFRWFQVEVSIFTNDYPDYRDAELWSPQRLELGYPPQAIEFRRMADFFRIENFAERVSGTPTEEQIGDVNSQQAEQQTGDLNPQQTEEPPPTAVDPVGPFPLSSTPGLRLPDLDRESFMLLPAANSDFQTTNTRLDSSPFNRLLFHGVWRQPVVQPEDASPLIVRGGRQYGLHHELEGTLTIRFNPNEDRVVIDTNLWLTEFSNASSGAAEWELPLPPGFMPDDVSPDTQADIPAAVGISRIVQMQQSRDMRSTEFHYLDHPAMGVVVTVLPYELPPPRSPDSFDTEEPPQPDL